MSLTNAKLFTGVSENGELEEALEDAVAHAKHHLQTDFVRWKLVTMSGAYGGFILQRHLVVTIEATNGVEGIADGGSAASAASGSNFSNDGPGAAEVPVFLSGPVFKSEIDFCMDEANYLLNTFVKQYRLRPTNDDANEVLEKASVNHEAVAIAGYPRSGPECNYIDVYYAGPIDDVIRKIGGSEAPR